MEAEAKTGDGYAMYKLGKIYYEGYGVNQDYQEALKWFNKSAEAGELYGHKRLIDMYYEGTGVEKDYEKVVYHGKMYRKGYGNAKYVLGYVKKAEEYLKNKKLKENKKG